MFDVLHWLACRAREFFRELSLGFSPSLALAFLVASAAAQETEPEHPFRFGFSAGLMPEVSENDYRAAMKAWAEMLVKNGAVQADSNVTFFPDTAHMVAALQRHEVDGVAATTPDFLAVRKSVKFNHVVFAVTGGTISDQFVLVVHQNSGLTNVENLRGHSLNLLRQPQMSLAIPWLDTLLLEQGFKPTGEFFSPIAEESKITKALLPVFFRKTDACLLTRKGFQTMCELNPQVGRELHVLASSPELVATAFFFREGYPAAQQDRCLNEFKNVHTTSAGQQILTVFQTERLEEYPVSVLDGTIALLEKHQRLLATMQASKASSATAHLGEPKGTTP